jgi:hypothetical protein
MINHYKIFRKKIRKISYIFVCVFKPSCMYYIGSKRQLSNPEKWPQFGQSGHGNKGPQMHCFFTCKRAKSCLPTLWLYSQKCFFLLWQTLKWQKIYLNLFQQFHLLLSIKAKTLLEGIQRAKNLQKDVLKF